MLALLLQTLFSEDFENDQLSKRGWYDGDRFKIVEGALEYHWKEGGTTPDSSSGIRRLFEPSETVYLRFKIKLSKGWGWSGRAYHPHLAHFMTTENGPWHGPAASRLTTYCEPQEGKLRLALQDIQNKDAPSGLTQGPLKGGYNGTMFDSAAPVFKEDTWQVVEAFYALNAVGQADGVVRGWVDGLQVVDRTDVVLRSKDWPTMKFNQFLLTPYFGPGLLPKEQTLWIDDLSVGVKRP